MLTGERGLPITSALRFLCVCDDRYSVIALGNKRYGSEPRDRCKGYVGRNNMNFSVVSVILQTVEIFIKLFIS